MSCWRFSAVCGPRRSRSRVRIGIWRDEWAMGTPASACAAKPTWVPLGPDSIATSAACRPTMASRTVPQGRIETSCARSTSGVKGQEGSLSIGRHYGLYYDYIDDELDRHRSHYSDAIVFGDLFVSNAVVYRSPDLSHGNFGILVELNDADGNCDAVEERVELAGTARFAGMSLHLGYVLSPNHDGLFGAALSHPVGALNIAAVFQQIDRGSADERLLSLAVDTKISETRLARIAVTQRGDSPDADLDDLYVIAGADQRLSGNLLVFLEVFVRVADGAGADESALVAGVRFDL